MPSNVPHCAYCRRPFNFPTVFYKVCDVTHTSEQGLLFNGATEEGVRGRYRWFLLSQKLDIHSNSPPSLMPSRTANNMYHKRLHRVYM
jgi:hypothetical protein